MRSAHVTVRKRAADFRRSSLPTVFPVQKRAGSSAQESGAVIKKMMSGATSGGEPAPNEQSFFRFKTDSRIKGGCAFVTGTSSVNPNRCTGIHYSMTPAGRQCWIIQKNVSDRTVLSDIISLIVIVGVYMPSEPHLV
mgnify:CR=1 FL=1